MSDKKTIKVREAVAVYSAILNVTNFTNVETADVCAILRNTKALKPIAQPQLDFEHDAAKRLEPANFAEIMEKHERFKDLSPEERREVDEALRDFNSKFLDCVRAEQEKDVEVEIEPMSEAAIAVVAKASVYMPLDMLLLIDDICGGK